MTNTELANFAITKIGTPYVLGTNGRSLTQSALNDLTKRNPSGWFTKARAPKLRALVGKIATDCHGLIEWFVREQTGKNYDVTADTAFSASRKRGDIGSIPEVPGVCVRYKGHVGVYIGGGYVVEARGFDYGTCLTKLTARPWTHWYEHPEIKYTGATLPAPSPQKVNRTTDRYSVVWLQLALNRQIKKGYIKDVALLTVDGEYGKKTALATGAYWRKKGWTKENEVWGVGKNTVKALART